LSSYVSSTITNLLSATYLYKVLPADHGYDEVLFPKIQMELQFMERGTPPAGANDVAGQAMIRASLRPITRHTCYEGLLRLLWLKEQHPGRFNLISNIFICKIAESELEANGSPHPAKWVGGDPASEDGGEMDSMLLHKYWRVAIVSHGGNELGSDEHVDYLLDVRNEVMAASRTKDPDPNCRDENGKQLELPVQHVNSQEELIEMKLGRVDVLGPGLAVTVSTLRTIIRRLDELKARYPFGTPSAPASRAAEARSVRLGTKK